MDTDNHPERIGRQSFSLRIHTQESQGYKNILMENKEFGYSAKQSAVASALIISSSSESQQEFQEFSANTAIALCPKHTTISQLLKITLGGAR